MSVKLLSLDWDYFVLADLETRIRTFPDGHVLPEALENTIWASHYANSENKLDSLRVDSAAVDKVSAIIKKSLNMQQCRGYMICRNHEDCYKFMRSISAFEHEKAFAVYNVDFHHDVYTDSNTLDCGNWLRFAMKDFDVKLCWIRRNSSDLSGTDMKFPKSHYSLGKLAEHSFDYIFICKSGLWSPPHLDKDFLRLCEPLIRSHVKRKYIESQALYDREIAVREMANQISEQMKDWKLGRKCKN